MAGKIIDSIAAAIAGALVLPFYLWAMNWGISLMVKLGWLNFSWIGPAIGCGR